MQDLEIVFRRQTRSVEFCSQGHGMPKPSFEVLYFAWRYRLDGISSLSAGLREDNRP